MKQRTELLVRLYISVLLLLGVAGLLIYKSFHINVIQGDHWREKGEKAHIKTVPLSAERGDIMAADGSLLATSLPFFEIRMDPLTPSMTDKVFEQHVDSLAWYLQKYVFPDRTSKGLATWLRQERRNGNKYILLQKNVNYDQMERFKTFPLLRRGKNRGGLIVLRQETRKKPFRGLASRTIGIVEGDRPGVGLENYYNDDLLGKSGYRTMRLVSGSQWIPAEGLEEISPVRGKDIVTTIDIGLQDEAHHALLGALEEHEADKGVAIVMEVKTGAIKAISNLTSTGQGYYAEIYNDAVGTAYEPGSTAKLASVMALLEDGYADVHSEVDVTGARTQFYDRVMKDASWHNMDVISLQRAFEKSSNVGIAKLVYEHYNGREKEKAFSNRFKQFGLNEITGIDLVGEDKPNIKDGIYGKQQWFGTSLPWMSIGYEMALTPLQLLNFYNAVANDGKLMQPYLVQSIVQDGEEVYSMKPKALKKRIASPYTIETAQDLLEQVVLRGTAENIKTGQVSMAGKTGTTQMDYANSQNKKAKYISSFAGYFPADEPRYSCVVVIWNPKKGHYYGSRVAAPVFKQIAIGATRRDQSMIRDFAHASFENREVLDKKGNQNDLALIMDELNLEYERTAPAEWGRVQGRINEDIALRVEDPFPEDKIDLIGYGAKDAVVLLERKGYAVNVHGKGEVAGVVNKNKEKSDHIDLVLE